MPSKSTPRATGDPTQSLSEVPGGMFQWWGQTERQPRGQKSTSIAWRTWVYWKGMERLLHERDLQMLLKHGICIGPIYPFIMSPYFFLQLCVLQVGWWVTGLWNAFKVLQSQSWYTWSPEWPQMVGVVDDRGKYNWNLLLKQTNIGWKVAFGFPSS